MVEASRRSGFAVRIPLHPGGGATNSMNDTSVSTVSFLCASALSKLKLKHKKMKRLRLHLNRSLNLCGKGGIRTHGTQSVQRFSRPPRSTTPAPFQSCNRDNSSQKRVQSYGKFSTRQNYFRDFSIRQWFSRGLERQRRSCRRQGYRHLPRRVGRP